MSSADSHFPAPPAAHLPAAVLRQYAAGTLTAPERRRVERHTLDCALCADALEGYQQAAPAATSPAALAELRQRLHARVAAEPAPARGAGWWMAAAAAVLVLLVAVGLWQQRPARPAASVAQASRPARAAERATPPPAAAPAAAEPAMDGSAPPMNEPAVAAAPAPPRRGIRRTAAGRVRPPQPVDYAANADAVSNTLPSDLGEAQGVAAEPATESVAAAPMADETAAPAAKLARSRVAVPPAAAAADTVVGEAKDKLSLAAVAPAAANAPAAVPLREESTKRKSELPPAPALAPFPNGGYPAFRAYLLREQELPPGARHVEGTVKLKFTVEADGTVHNIQVVRGLNEELDAEAIRLVCEGPAWRPAIVNGRRATQTVRVDVLFR